MSLDLAETMLLVAAIGSCVFYFVVSHFYRKFAKDLKKAIGHSRNSPLTLAVENWADRVPTCPETCPLLRAGRDVCKDVCIQEYPKLKQLKESSIDEGSSKSQG